MRGCVVPSGTSAHPHFSVAVSVPVPCSAFISVDAWVPLCSAFLCREGPFYHTHLSISPPGSHALNSLP